MVTASAALAATTPSAGYDVSHKDCPARQMLERLADKWSLLIVRQLSTGPRRFNQLRRDIGGISQKALSQTLQKLERDGLVHREAFATVPVTVEYSLSPLGRDLSGLVAPLAAWAEVSIERILLAQRDYDRRRAASSPSIVAD